LKNEKVLNSFLLAFNIFINTFQQFIVLIFNSLLSYQQTLINAGYLFFLLI